MLALPAARASQSLSVLVRGVVCAAEPDWQGKFFIQDASGGIFVDSLGQQPRIGDLLEVEGVSTPGSFAPTIKALRWRKIGTAPLPPAKEVTIERLMAGVEDSQRIEITGLVRSAVFAPTQKLMLEISIGAYRVRAFPKLPGNVNPQSLIAAKVRARGSAATAFNAARRQLTAVNLFIPTAEDFVIEQPEEHPPFDQPTVDLGEIARYRPNASLGERLHVKGTVTIHRLGDDLFIQDSSGGLRIETQQARPAIVGRPIEAVGFLEFVNYQPVLKDAVFRELSDSAEPVKPAFVPASELRNGLHTAELIVMRGKLLDRSIRPVARDNVAFTGVRVLCTIQTPELTFTAEREETQPTSYITSVPLGSLVELQGVASCETDDGGKLKSLRLLLPETESLRILETPSWFTSERLLIGFAVMCVLLAGVAGWLLTVSKKNVMLSYLVSEREKAQRELQQAHDQLEERVKERTEQLKIEMTVRKTAELEFRAVLTERTRLARELHDTLEQALTGIALQLDTASKLFQREPASAGQPLELARGFLKQSQLDLRRSIWDLRSRELEQFDLAEALTIASKQISSGSPIKMDFTFEGERQRLPEVVEETLLRISQEALTNVVKHSGATQVTVRLTFGAENVSLEIKDNGTGLVPDRLADRSDHHFGLLGMSERAKRLGGRLDVSSAQNEGTTVRVVISLRDQALLEPQPQAVI